MKKLTAKQESILAFIENYLSKNMQMPTQEEIASSFSITPAGVHYHLVALEKKKALTLNKNVSRGIVLADTQREKRENVSIPFFKKTPSIENLEKGISDTFYIPRELRLDNPFAFEVLSLSMKEAGILVGDIAIMERTDSAKNGDIVLAYIPDSQNNFELRRFIRTPHFVELQSENENMGTIKSMNVIVYGVLKSIWRKYN